MILNSAINLKKSNRKALAVLIDPDKIASKGDLSKLLNICIEAKVDFIFIGGSLITTTNFDEVVEYVKENINIPVVLFPGNNLQISQKADALLMLSLISGRNPEYLIGQHVIAAPLLRKSGLEIVSTGYILIGDDRETSVSYISNTKSIPSDKVSLVIATAIAGEMLGMKMLYLEAGSGAEKPVPQHVIQKVRSHTDIPIIVGGGIRNEYQAEKAYESGADIVVIGNILEKDPAKIADIADKKESINARGKSDIHQ